ncbi:MAG TPA: hypothetical protein VLI05_03380 [Candidatus Saccharimonadia bacterium]|nr:hypothetical protein [Candidatus Saccharimonadia bacterium]
MPIKVSIIAIIFSQRRDAILLRKKPAGAPPYRQSWYLPGAELDPDKSDEEAR